MKRLALVVLALGLAACDSAAPDVASGFQATVAGAFERSLSGDAATTDLNGVGFSSVLPGGDEFTVLRLEASDSDDAFYLVGFNEAALAPGEYAVNPVTGQDRLFAGFMIAYEYPLAGGEFVTRGLSFADTGTVTIRQVDAEIIAGEFAFEGRVLMEGDPPTTQPISVQGRFTAEVREPATAGSR